MVVPYFVLAQSGTIEGCRATAQAPRPHLASSVADRGVIVGSCDRYCCTCIEVRQCDIVPNLAAKRVAWCGS